MPQKPTQLNMQDALVTYYPNFLNTKEAAHYFNNLYKTIPWKQDCITLFGKTYPEPRLKAFFANNNKSYSYSNINMKPLTFNNTLVELKLKIENTLQINFTSCLANLYRNGQDSNGWHADDEKELGNNPIIASLSLGEARWFHFKHKTDKTLKQKLLLESGSLLVMQKQTQHFWLHQLPKSKKILNPRINLTFRIIK